MRIEINISDNSHECVRYHLLKPGAWLLYKGSICIVHETGIRATCIETGELKNIELDALVREIKSSNVEVTL